MISAQIECRARAARSRLLVNFSRGTQMKLAAGVTGLEIRDRMCRYVTQRAFRYSELSGTRLPQFMPVKVHLRDK